VPEADQVLLVMAELSVDMGAALELWCRLSF
jgi:hypothetical protein